MGGILLLFELAMFNINAFLLTYLKEEIDEN